MRYVSDRKVGRKKTRPVPARGRVGPKGRVASRARKGTWLSARPRPRSKRPDGRPTAKQQRPRFPKLGKAASAVKEMFDQRPKVMEALNRILRFESRINILVGDRLIKKGANERANPLQAELVALKIEYAQGLYAFAVAERPSPGVVREIEKWFEAIKNSPRDFE